MNPIFKNTDDWFVNLLPRLIAIEDEINSIATAGPIDQVRLDAASKQAKAITAEVGFFNVERSKELSQRN